MVEEEDNCYTFSDEDFERRYSSEETTPSSPPLKGTKSFTAKIARSRNRYMRTLRRRLLASGLR